MTCAPVQLCKPAWHVGLHSALSVVLFGVNKALGAKVKDVAVPSLSVAASSHHGLAGKALRSAVSPQLLRPARDLRHIAPSV